MRLGIAIFFLILNAFPLKAQQYSSADSIKIEQLLREGAALKEGENRILFFAKKFIGVPYVAHTLDRNSEENLVVNTKELDCTTFVETVLALSLCSQSNARTFHDYCAMLQKIRYRQGRVEYPSRLHYFTDWIEDNEQMGLVQKIQSDKAPFTAVQHLKINYMTTHSSAYSMLKAHPEWLLEISSMEKKLTGKSYRYIPKSGVNNSKLLRSTIKDGDIIAILTSKAGLDTSHIGIAVWQKDGLHLLNASQIHKKVVLEPMLFRTYMQKHPSQIGIRLCRMADISQH